VTRLVLRLVSAGFLTAILLTVLVASVGLEMVRLEAANLPDASSLSTLREDSPSRMLAADGTTMGQFASKDREPVRFNDVPALVRSAFVSAEDKDFWRHQGVDPLAIARAEVSNLRNRGTGRRQLGASTITQQVVKNLLVGDEHTLRRKVREALLALRLEKTLGKPRVLEIYLNEIYLGQGAWGVGAASRIYFGKPLGALDLAEAAFLAALPKGPSNYDPVRRPDAARARRAYVLARMVEDGVATPEAARAADAEPLPVPTAHTLSGPAEGYFAEEARREVVARFGADVLYRGGMTVRTSMDPALQALAERALRDGLCDYDRRHGWRGPLAKIDLGDWTAQLARIEPPPGTGDWRTAVVLGFGQDGSASLGLADGHGESLPFSGVRWARRDLGDGRTGPFPRSARDALAAGDVVLVSPGADGALELRQAPEVEGALVAMDVRTGRVLALVGGFSQERGSFDRATQSLRQPGSTFKSFVYLTAFENGWDPTSPVLDVPIAIDPGQGAPTWRPGADGGGGWGIITARRALENSRNLSSVRLLYDLGLDAVGDTARRFGLYGTLPNYADALGALETTDLRMTTAYAEIANGGHRIVPSLVDSAEGPAGTAAFRREEVPHDETARIADPVAVAQLTSVLEGVVRHGTAARAIGSLALPIAGKTGTTNDDNDALFVGFVPQMVT
jgi:penicillin-binding protein 1A